jgi:phosphoglycerate dehydrogenase-like enzyme
MALVALSTCLPQLIQQQRSHVWSPIFTRPIQGNVCVVIGFGDMGQAAGRACKKLGLKVVAITRSGRAFALADKVLPDGKIDEVLPGADFVIVAAPLTTRTRNIMSRSRLARLPRAAGVINISRAPLVDYSALREMLLEDRLAGAILDVHDPEPLLAESNLWDTPNLILTPHISSDDPRYVDMLLDAWFENLGRFVAKKPLRNIVDRVLEY